MTSCWTISPLAEISAEHLSTMLTGFLVVMGTLTVLIVVMKIPSGISRWLESRRSARETAIREEHEAARGPDGGTLVAILTAAASEMLGSEVHVVRHQSARQRSDAQRWVATGRSAHFDSHRVRRR